MKINARKMAIKILNRIEIDQQFSHRVINEYFREFELEPIDRRFVSSVVLGVLENKMLLDYYIRYYSKLRFGKINREVVNILRLGMYQILFMDRVPNSAAVDESVKLAKKINQNQGGYVNAILRNFVRTHKQVKLPDRNKNLIDFLSITYSHPQWLIRKWLNVYGETFTEALLSSNNEMPNVVVRVNTLKTDRQTLIELFKREGIEASKSKWAKDGIVIEKLKGISIEAIPGFRDGLFQIQDESSMFIGEIANVKEGDFVMDVCAAPGGKTCHVAQKMNNKGHVLARDLREDKLHLIRDNAERLNIDIIETQVFDASVFDYDYRRKAACVIVDAPCSGLGIIRRKPDIKYNKSEDDLANLVEIQTNIINTCSEYVKIGGELIYSTCTINPDENQNIINQFLKHHSQFTLVDLSEYKSNVNEQMLSFFPNRERTDGFFIAKLKRKL